jgi:hypothetical protein
MTKLRVASVYRIELLLKPEQAFDVVLTLFHQNYILLDEQCIFFHHVRQLLDPVFEEYSVRFRRTEKEGIQAQFEQGCTGSRYAHSRARALFALRIASIQIQTYV